MNSPSTPDHAAADRFTVRKPERKLNLRAPMRTALLALLTVALAACGGSDSPPQNPTGVLLKKTVLGTLAAAQAKEIFDAMPAVANLPASQRAALAAEVIHGVQVVSFEYTTSGPSGELRKASALALLPTTPALTASTLAYMHGTSTKRSDIPSAGEYDENVLPAVLFAARGRLVIAPDYLGLGTSDLAYHPYLHRDTLAAAGRDALAAGMDLAKASALALDGNLFVAGFSEGGFAAAALQRKLQQAPLAALALRGTMSIAGPLDLPAAVPLALAADPASGSNSGRSVYTAFTAWAYQRVYGNVYAQPTEMFNSPYASQLNALFDGTRSADEIAQALPASPRALFTPATLTALIGGTHPISARIRDNDVIDINPGAPLMSCHGTVDDTVPYAVTVAARDRLTARGATLNVLPQTGLDHGESLEPCMVEAARLLR
jgi:pimeloyl-ACP methyl ester carboxylesterase